MTTFNNLSFCGKFRDYQQAVLDKAQKHLKDNKIHIVAAPGSGKTILGLELIKRAGNPAIVLSPSVTIRQQWGERLKMFCKDGNTQGFVSYDLKQPSLLTSVTYQALYAAVTKSKIKEEQEDEVLTETETDYSGFDLLATVKAAGITTICLDEAHHLKTEWQKALESFISSSGIKFTVIALTATPPYDSTPAQWKRYIDLCGEIDEEIFVPQLVKQKSLCPHQDYIYFSYPTQEETEILKAYRERAAVCTEAIAKSSSFAKASAIRNEDFLLENYNQFRELFSFAKQYGVPLSQGSVNTVAPIGLPKYKTEFAQNSFQFIIDNPEIFGEQASEEIRAELAGNGLIEKNRVCLKSNESIDKMLLTSVGKIKGINEIISFETANMKDSLRMLILTDYIKKDMKKLIGTDEPISSLGTVPIFETVRRRFGNSVGVGMLSGTIVIIPKSSAQVIAQIAEKHGVSYSFKLIENTEHFETTFSGSNKNKVQIITEAFEMGLINILIGTKSLLGEGWDSPCINSLILASFVGSYMLSNQMRGRAIRTYSKDPNKSANIWHLVSLEPQFEYANSEIQSSYTRFINDFSGISGDDFETIKRRFTGFLAPAYSKNVIESGIDRIDILTPPFSRDGIDRINNNMLSLSSNRKLMVERWNDSLKSTGIPEVVQVNEIPSNLMPKGIMKGAILRSVLTGIIGIIILLIIGAIISNEHNFIRFLFMFPVFVTVFGIICSKISSAKKFSTPLKTVQSFADGLLKSLTKAGKITSRGAKATVESKGEYIYCMLTGADNREKSVFSKSMSEMLSPIDCPRYIFQRTTSLFGLKFTDSAFSFSCPSVIANNKENAEIITKNMKCGGGKLVAIYTHGEQGHIALLKIKKISFINAVGIEVKDKKIVK